MLRRSIQITMQTTPSPPQPLRPLPGLPPLPLPQGPPPPHPLWQSHQLRRHLSTLFQNLSLLKAVTKELEGLISVKEADGAAHDGYETDSFYFCDSERSISTRAEVKEHPYQELEPLAREAAQSLHYSLEIQLAPLQAVLVGAARWEDKAAAVKLADKRSKIRRNRKWRLMKRRKASERHKMEQENFEQADIEADNWRAKEIAKDIARRQMEKMKEVAERKAKEERLRLKEELEQVLLVEKLQELRALRMQKLKKQGRFFPEEDNQFIDRVRAAVEEEERQAAAAADTSAAALAIASAEQASRAAKPVSSETGESHGAQIRNLPLLKKDANDLGEPLSPSREPLNPNAGHDNLKAHLPKAPQSQDFCGLPPEYYHYYYGSSTDIGTLIEVRRNWDTFIMQGGSRIPSHWIQAPFPSDSTWASYLIKDSGKKDGVDCETGGRSLKKEKRKRQK